MDALGPGDLVRCILNDEAEGANAPLVGRVYTIREVGDVRDMEICQCHDLHAGGILLVDHPDPEPFFWWCILCFEPFKGGAFDHLLSVEDDLLDAVGREMAEVP